MAGGSRIQARSVARVNNLSHWLKHSLVGSPESQQVSSEVHRCNGHEREF